MAYSSTTKTLTITDTYGSYHQQAKVTVTVDGAGKVDWTIAMSNDHAGSYGRGVYLSVKIAGVQVGPNKYIRYSDENDSRWRTYPTGNGTSKSGSFTLSDPNVSSITISVYICCMQNSTTAGESMSETLTRKTYDNGTGGTITIRDEKCNLFTVEFNRGEDGHNNPISSEAFWVAQYKYNDGSWCWESLSYSGGTEEYGCRGESFTLGGLTSGPTRPVAAAFKTVMKNGHEHYVEVTADINQYRNPGAPSNARLTDASYSGGRLTVRKPWTFSWTAADAVNTTSPIEGYRVRLWHNGILIPIFDYNYTDAQGGYNGYKQLSIQSGYYGGAYPDYYWDTESTSTSFTIHHDVMNACGHFFNPGDTIQMAAYAYTKNGLGEKMFSASEAYSPVYPIENSGVMRVRVNNEWKEGQVFVRVDNTWKEATEVKVRVNGQWVEST